MFTRNKFSTITAVALLMIAMAFSLASCTKEKKPAQRNVLVISLYGVGLDAIGAYSTKETFTPVIDGIVEKSFRIDSSKRVVAADDDDACRIQSFKKAGYATAAFLAVNRVCRTGNMGFEKSDFDFFSEASTNYLERATDNSSIPHGAMRHNAFPKDPAYGIRRGEEIASEAISWISKIECIDVNAHRRLVKGASDTEDKTLNEKCDSPFFLLVEFADTLFRNSPERTRSQGFKIANPYNIEVAYIDLQIGRILSFLEANGLKDNTDVFILSNGAADSSKNAGEDFSFLPDEVPTVTNLCISTAIPSADDSELLKKLFISVAAFGGSVFPRSPLPFADYSPIESEMAAKDLSRKIGTEDFFSASGNLPVDERKQYAKLWLDVSNRMRHPTTNDVTLATDLDHLMKTNRDSATLHVWRGVTHSINHETDKAIAEYRKANELSPGEPYILSNLGLALLESGDIPGGIDKIEDAYLSDTSNPEYRDNLATVLMNTGITLARNKVFNEAVACMTRVLFLQPKNPLAYVNMGGVYQSMGRNDLAETSYRQALDIKPNFGPAKRAIQTLKNGKLQEKSGATK